MNFLKKAWRPLLAVSLILVLIKKGPFNLEQLKFTLSHVEILWLGFSVFFAQQLLFAIRWRLFTGLIVRISSWEALKLTLIGQFFNVFVPGGVGGDIVKALELSKHKAITRSEALSTVMSDRIFGLFAMIGFTMFFLGADYAHHQDQYVLKFLILSACLFGGMALTLLFLPAFFGRISKFLATRESPLMLRIEKLIASLHFTFMTFRNVRLQGKSVLISLLGQLIGIYFMFEVVKALGAVPPPFLVFFSLCCFVFVASAIPIFPGGIGMGQAAIYLIFSNISEDLAKAAVIAVTALQIFNLFYALLGGLAFSFMHKSPDSPNSTNAKVET